MNSAAPREEIYTLCEKRTSFREFLFDWHVYFTTYTIVGKKCDSIRTLLKLLKHEQRDL